MADQATYTLKHPIEMKARKADGSEYVIETITEVRYPVGVRMKARDLRATGSAENDVDRTLLLIGHYTGLSQKAVDELDVEDVEALSVVIAEFRNGVA